MKFLLHLFKNPSINKRQNDIYREWDRRRAEAMTPSHRAEIDAIFGRQL